MTGDGARIRHTGEGRHRRLAIVLASVALGMVGMAYAAVPLYQLFCQVTGYAGTPKRATSASSHVVERTIAVRFDANTSPALPWRFEPAERQMELKLGENRLAFYRAVNDGREPVVGTATFNVTPDVAAPYFNKIACFCFTEQTLQPGQSVDMPVSFFIDPAIMKDKDAAHLTTITLSYTFYPVHKPQGAASVREAPKSGAAASKG